MKRRSFLRGLVGVSVAVASGVVTALFDAQPRQVLDTEYVEEMVKVQVRAVGYSWDGPSKTTLQCAVIEFHDIERGFIKAMSNECTVVIDRFVHVIPGDYIQVSRSMIQSLSLLDQLRSAPVFARGRLIGQRLVRL